MRSVNKWPKMSEAGEAGAGWGGLTSRPSAVVGFCNDLFVQEGKIMNGLMSRSLQGTQAAAARGSVIHLHVFVPALGLLFIDY